MSNHLAIATVTAAFTGQLLNAAQVGVGEAKLRIGAPDATTATDGKPVVNVFLYQITPNAQQRNTHMPSRRTDGTQLERSRVALDLRYVLSFYGDAAKYQPELMAGAVAAAIEDRPLLSDDAIKKAITDAAPTLDKSDLRDALSRVRITPETHTLEELSRMWSIFFQVPYALSVSYVCSHVSIEIGDDGTVPLPVALPRIRAAPFPQIAIASVTSAAGPNAPITWGGTLVVEGRRLNAPGLTLRIDGDVVAPSAGARPDEVRIELDAATFGGTDLPAGHHTVRAIVHAFPGRLAQSSEAAVFALRPRLTVTSAGVSSNPTPTTATGAMTITFEPAIAKDQEVELLLDEITATDPAAARLSATTPAGFPASSVEFEYTKLKRAVYLVRAMVDGVASVHELDDVPGSPTFGTITGPKADLT